MDLFSDGGPKHYKSVYGMRTMAQWADWWADSKPDAKVPVLYWNFTCPNHGHGAADGHAGNISQMNLRAQKKAQHQNGLAAKGPSNAYELAEMCKDMKGAHLVVFPTIERPPERTDLKPLFAIRAHFQFRL